MKKQSRKQTSQRVWQTGSSSLPTVLGYQHMELFSKLRSSGIYPNVGGLGIFSFLRCTDRDDTQHWHCELYFMGYTLQEDA